MRKLLPALLCLFAIVLISFSLKKNPEDSWIRINQLGYKPAGVKVAVWGSKRQTSIASFQVVNASSGKVAYTGSAGKPFGSYGPFVQTYRLNFSDFIRPGNYYLQAGNARSPEFEISEDVYKGAADFCLRYMRQQRTGFNPYLNDSCHTQDGYVLYGKHAGIKDSTHFDVVGGWHDASDYLQYSSTSANATYHLLAAYRDFKKVFSDEKQANGLDGSNGVADVLDEARWGLQWLLKMHPAPDIMFNQIADDRDHMGMRMPKEDSFYGKGFERPVYFIDGEPQQRGKFMNNTKGTSSTAAKFSSAFALGAMMHRKNDPEFSNLLSQKSRSAFQYALKKPGVTQTVSVRSPYIYAEENWVDDMELATAALLNETDDKNLVNAAMEYAAAEKTTPWLGADTASHYQWYPFINMGHYELAKQITGNQRKIIVDYYKEGIEMVWNKAKTNAFYRGIPYIWCSNNLTTSFAIQCYWYKQLTGDHQFDDLEQANFDWLFGCNPWGTSMVYGLPAHGDTPDDPHSAFTHIGHHPIDGGLVDGPVYSSIYKNLIGITLYEPDEYAAFQSDLAVYHDDYGDYSTNEPTMDGTASLIYLLAAKEAEVLSAKTKTKDIPKVKKLNEGLLWQKGAIIRGDSTVKKLALVFTGHEFADGGNYIRDLFKNENVKASFFFTGDFYRNPAFSPLIQQLKSDGHYLGAHSDKHLLYCDWVKRDSLFLTQAQFTGDLQSNFDAMKQHGISKSEAPFFLPPYEWYNDSIASWAQQMGLRLINYTPGTLSHADYTTPNEKNYRSSQTIYQSIMDYKKQDASGLNGFMLLMHIGTDEKRTDKFYHQLPALLQWLRGKGYQLVSVNQLLAGKE